MVYIYICMYVTCIQPERFSENELMYVLKFQRAAAKQSVPFGIRWTTDTQLSLEWSGPYLF